MPAIETEGLRKVYGDVVALDGLDITVDRGELYGLLGPNGSGKTTTIEILTGQRTPTAGRVRVLGIDPVADPLEVRRAVGILPEREDPPSFLTAREYLEFVGDVRSIPDVESRIEQWADRFEFRGILDTLTTDLSEGERQRVMLAQVFIHEPELAFIDEPLVNLDPLMQAKVKTELARYCEDGNTLFLSTHFVEVAEQLCTEVGIVGGGRLLTQQDPAEMTDGLLATYESAVTRDSESMGERDRRNPEEGEGRSMGENGGRETGDGGRRGVSGQ